MALSPSNRPKLVRNLDSPRSKPVLHIVAAMWLDDWFRKMWNSNADLTSSFLAHLPLCRLHPATTGAAIAARSVIQKYFHVLGLVKAHPNKSLAKLGCRIHSVWPLPFRSMIHSFGHGTHATSQGQELHRVQECHREAFKERCIVILE